MIQSLHCMTKFLLKIDIVLVFYFSYNNFEILANYTAHRGHTYPYLIQFKQTNSTNNKQNKTNKQYEL